MIRTPEHLPTEGLGDFCYALTYLSWKRGYIVPIYADDGTLPIFATREQAEDAAIAHNLPWHRLVLLAFSANGFVLFAQHQKDWAAYQPSMTFDMALQEATEGRLRRVAQPVVVEV